MSRIDVENAKQIRNPMDVLITMEVPATDITLTYSGYSSAKVADGILGESTWPMRLLADLKGDGFPLDGTRVVYDPNTTASATNGKIGVRSNIGQSVSVTVTGNRTISSLSIFATGAESVTYNGTTSAIVGGQVIIPVGARSITLTFNPASATERIEVSEIVAGTALRITNDTLIKAVVSLRSDLQPIDPTLPESELNVDVYNDADISEIVASLPEDTPITYQAGYEGDMSPIRNFYVSGQVTWVDNVLSIHAVDAVHFLDIDVPTMYISRVYHERPEALLGVLRGVLENVVDGRFTSLFYVCKEGGEDKESVVVPTGLSLREMTAEVMNLFRFRDIPTSYLETPGENQLVFTYVDAGRPRVRYDDLHGDSWNIREEDCANVDKKVERRIKTIRYKRKLATVYSGDVGTAGTMYDGVPCGSAQLLINNGAFASFDDYVFAFMLGTEKSVLDFGFPYTPLVPWTETGWVQEAWPDFPIGSICYRVDNCHALVTSETKNGELIDGYGQGIYTQVIPWDVTYEQGAFPYNSLTATWNGLVNRGIISSNANYYDLTIYGYKVAFEDKDIVVESPTIRDGESVEMEARLNGRNYFWITEIQKGGEAFPLYGLKELLKRSPITCSFTWKGDPRIQPRDVFTFHRLDGTDEDWTFENITLTHEKGGTVAEITARKGIV